MVGKAQSSPIDKRGPFLERPDEPCDAGLVQLAVGVGDQLQGQRVNTRIAQERWYRELGQQLIVPRRQVAAHLAQGVFDDMEIVDEPLGVDPVPVSVGGELFVDPVQNVPVLNEPLQ